MTTHCVLDYASQPPVFRCLACGAAEPLLLPMAITEVVELSEQFETAHRRCRPISPSPSFSASPQPSPFPP